MYPLGIIDMWRESIILLLFHRQNLKSHTDEKAHGSTCKVNKGGGLIHTVKKKDADY